MLLSSQVQGVQKVSHSDDWRQSKLFNVAGTHRIKYEGEVCIRETEVGEGDEWEGNCDLSLGHHKHLLSWSQLDSVFVCILRFESLCYEVTTSSRLDRLLQWIFLYMFFDSWHDSWYDGVCLGIFSSLTKNEGSFVCSGIIMPSSPSLLLFLFCCYLNRIPTKYIFQAWVECPHHTLYESLLLCTMLLWTASQTLPPRSVHGMASGWLLCSLLSTGRLASYQV